MLLLILVLLLKRKRKRAKLPGLNGKGNASNASGKTVAPTSMDGEVGDKMRGEEVEMEGTDPEETNSESRSCS